MCDGESGAGIKDRGKGSCCLAFHNWAASNSKRPRRNNSQRHKAAAYAGVASSVVVIASITVTGAKVVAGVPDGAAWKRGSDVKQSSRSVCMQWKGIRTVHSRILPRLSFWELGSLGRDTRFVGKRSEVVSAQRGGG